MANDLKPKGIDAPVSPDPEEARLRARLKAMIPEDEELLWVGRPDPARATWEGVGSSVLGILFLASFAWLQGGTGIGHEFERSSSGVFHREPGGFSYFEVFESVFAILAGVFLLGAPYWSRQAARNTLYAVTPRRLLIVRLGHFPVAQSYLLPELPFLRCREGKRGAGDLFFSSRTESSGEGGTTVVELGFLGIPNVRAVEQLVRSLLPSPGRTA